jgi:hypothetical protein
MHKRTARFRFFAFALGLTGLSPSVAYCDEPPPNYGQPAQQSAPAKPAAPSPNNEIFKVLKAKCETDVSCGRASGDVCAEAAAILVGNDRPDEFREMNEVQRIKIALRLLEKGVDSSNLAASRAYDYYAKFDLLFGLGSGAYADSYRANELMEMMVRKSYPGATLRKARSTVSIFSVTVGDPQKIQACALAAQMKAGGKLDADSLAVADEVISSNFCKTLNAPPVK